MTRLLQASLTIALLALALRAGTQDDRTMRVFIFAGQSNMEGADSKVADIVRYPPFRGLGEANPKVRFRYCIGRENKSRSKGWEDLAPVRNMVGPELSFAREVGKHTKAPLAIIKVAAGGTHLGGDWNPDKPQGFEMFPLALKFVQEALADLERRGVRYRLEGFMWHQGENDMFEDAYREAYGKNLAHFIARWRKELKTPQLRFYIGELCTKTVWGMDNRRPMYGISVGQKKVCAEDPNAEYVPTSHVGVEIGNPYGLHYHYGTLGQLQHGVMFARAYLRATGVDPEPKARTLRSWPYRKGKKVKLFIVAGHRNAEGERAFVLDLRKLRKGKALAVDNHRVAFRYDTGGGVRVSKGWEPLGPAGFSETFGPELSLAAGLRGKVRGDFAIAKFTHSGSQMIDWTPKGSEAKDRNLYPRFIAFIKEAIASLEEKGQRVELAGVFYHVGENDSSYFPYRRAMAERLEALVEQSRRDLKLADLDWFVSQQTPTDHEDLNGADVTADLEALAERDPHLAHWKVFKLPAQDRRLVLNARGVVALGQTLARNYLRPRR